MPCTRKFATSALPRKADIGADIDLGPISADTRHSTGDEKQRPGVANGRPPTHGEGVGKFYSLFQPSENPLEEVAEKAELTKLA